MDVDERLRAIEERLAILERRIGVSAAVAEVGEHRPAEAGPPFDLAAIGKAILILGGAFLLRAATESATLPKHVGVTLGLLYAAAWFVVSIRSKRVFTAATAAFIAYPIVWEATSRFGVLTAAGAAAILILLGGALIIAGERFAWIAAIGSTIDALLLAWETKEIVPFLLELAVIGAIALLFSSKYVGWLLAIECDLFAILLVIVTLLDDKRSNPVIWLILAGAIWLVKPGVHAIAGAVTGFGGAAALILLRNMPAMTAAITMLIFAAIAYVLAFRRDEMFDSIAAGVAALCGSLLVLDPIGRTIAWGIAAIATAEIARRRSSIAFAMQSSAWGIASAVPLVSIAAPFSFVAFIRKRSIVLLAIAAGGAAWALIHATPQPLVRAVVLCAASLALAIAGRRWEIREASQLSIVALVVTGVFIVAQGFNATMMFVALAVYGLAMLAIARLNQRRVVAPQ